MAKYRIKAPDGSTFEVTAPDSASEADVMAYAQRQFAEQAPTIEKSAAVQAGEAIGGIPRQAGLFARYVPEAAAQLAEIGTEPIRKLLVNPAARLLGAKPVGSLSEGVSGLADWIGLPKPQGANERVIGDMTKLGLSSMGLVGAARAGANATQGAIRSGMEALAANPGQQVIGAVGAGGAGGAVREAGGGPLAQFGASMIGGIAAPLAANAVGGAAQRAGSAIKTALTPQRMIDQAVDQQLNLTLRQAGIDYAGLSERVKQGMRAQAQRAISRGDDLDPAALARLIEFQRVPGVTPTRGMLSQDPGQITREKNLAKIGANSTDIGLNRLSGLESDNTRVLLNTLDDAGARNAPDSFAAGERGISALQNTVDRNRANIRGLYNAARDTQGRSLPLDGHAWTTNANRLLDEHNVGSFLPPDIVKKMNAIAGGEYPLTVDVAEQLKTSMGNISRGSNDGNVRHALKLVRQALDDTPLQNSPTVNHGNLPAVPGTVPPSATVAGQESIDAFNAARSANRSWMQRVESTPALQAVIDGIEPDRFVQRFITGQSASVADVRALRQAASANPEALSAVKNHLVAHLRGAATGQGTDINKFRADSYNNALNAIGERKLSAFFSPEEIAQLRAIGKVSNYMSAQPAGTAVNNSNSGALVAAKAMDALDAIAGKLPLGLDTTIQGVIRGTQQRRALSLPPALTAPVQTPRGLLDPVSRTMFFGGLLASQPVDNQ